MRYNQILGFSLLFAIFIFFGCNDNDDPAGPVDEGTFSVTVTGDVSFSFSGTAVFGSGTDPETGEQGFILWLTTDTQEMESGESLWLARIGGTRPGTGTFVISNVEEFDDENWNTDHFYAAVMSANTFLGSESGTMQVTSSSTNRFTGSFEFTASGHSFQDGSEITATVEGNFDAIGGTIFFPGF